MHSDEALFKRIQTRQLVSCANNTKWQAFIEAVAHLSVNYRVKCVFLEHSTTWESISSPARNYIDTISLGPIPFKEIEWLETDPIERQFRGLLVPPSEIDHSPDLIVILQKLHLDFVENDGLYQVFGYREPTRND